jgi:hypothetical protein
VQEAVTPGQLSLAAGVVKVTMLDPPGVGVTDVMVGQTIIGGTVSLTVIVNEHGCDVLPKESLAVHMTVVSPFGKVEPEGGEQFATQEEVCWTEAERIIRVRLVDITAPPPPLHGQSVCGENSTTAAHLSGSVETEKLSGQTIVGV